MHSPSSIWRNARRYSVLRLGLAPLDAQLGRRLSRFEARELLTALEHDDASTLRLLYLQLNACPSVVQLSNQAVLSWLLGHVDGEPGACFALVELASAMPSVRTPARAAPSPESARRIDLALRQLGASDLVHRGSAYRFLRIGKATASPDRDTYEVLGPAQAQTLLKEMVPDRSRTEIQQAALTALLALLESDALAAREPLLLMLRRQRAYERAVEAGSALTPSQLRAESHFIEVQAIDAAQKPVAGVALELVLSTGETRSLSTDAAGFARLDRIQAGSVTIRVRDLDGSTWRALEGGTAQVSTASATAARTHVVRQDECLSRIAQRYGHADWKQIWEHPDNAALRERRTSPHVLWVGDRISVPAVQIYEIVRATDATHRIEVKRPVLELKLVLGDHHGRPFKNQPYELRLARDAAEPLLRGTTSGTGELCEKLPQGITHVFVSLPAQGLSWPVRFNFVPPLPASAQSALDAEDKPSMAALRSLQTRLNALGIASGRADGAWNRSTQLALAQLRRGQKTAPQDHPLCDADLSALESFGV